MRGTQLIRQWKIIRFLLRYHQGFGATELAGMIGAPIRTVYRDMEALKEVGFPLEQVRDGKYSTWRLRTDGSEIRELLALERVSAPLAGMEVIPEEPAEPQRMEPIEKEECIPERPTGRPAFNRRERTLQRRRARRRW